MRVLTMEKVKSKTMDDLQDINVCIREMHKYMSLHKAADESKIKDELQSYNLMHNEKYYNLSQVKYILDLQVKETLTQVSRAKTKTFKNIANFFKGKDDEKK